jgi:hypothetical protein
MGARGEGGGVIILGRGGSKIAQTTHLGIFFALFTKKKGVSHDFCLFSDIFGDFFLPLKALDERVGVPLFWAKGG